MSGVKLHFMGWHTPVLDWCCDLLIQEMKQSVLDLTRTVILVPTAETARRLRERLAVRAAEHQGAVMAPYVWSPEAALLWNTGTVTMAGSMEEQQAWLSVLQNIRLEDYPALFPTEPVIDKKSWAAGVADTLVNLRRSTGAGGYSFARVSEKLQGGEDAQRWEELAALEQAYLTQLQKASLEDMQNVKAHAANAGAVPEGVEKVLAFALPDPPALIREWLSTASQRVPVSVYVHAPVDLRQDFDLMGIPLLSVWAEQPPSLKLKNENLHLESHAEQQAQCAVKQIKRLVSNRTAVALGLCDPSLAPHLVAALGAEGVVVYDPAGKSATQHPVLDLLKTWQALAETRLWRHASVLLRQDDVLSVVAPAHGFKFAELLNALDAFYQKHLPGTVDDALRLCDEVPVPPDAVEGKNQKLRRLFADIVQRLNNWKTGSVEDALRGVLEWIYGSRDFKTEGEHDRDYAVLLGMAMRLAVQAQLMSQQMGGKMGVQDLMPLLLRELEAVSLPDPRGEVGLVLRGWLELLWEPAPGLVVCGFNDENVPGVVPVDAFLPDHVRESLGLSCQRSRCARDAYLLTAMNAQRQGSDSLHLVIGQKGEDENVLRPSRLLFACDDASLPQRVKHLFPEETEAASVQEPPHTVSWKLRPRVKSDWLRTISPSLLKSYLYCPTRCYLKYALSMQPVNAAQREMTASDFGILMHGVLDAFGSHTTVRESFNEKEIAEFMDDTVVTLAREQWGGSPMLSTTLQLETARQRLAHVAKVQAQLRQDGWRIAEVEFDLNPKKAFTLAGIPFTARADRVDVHRDGRMRIIDYKTGTKGTSPDKVHISPVGAEALADPDTLWKCFEGPRGGGRQWIELQLPLYVWSLQQIHPHVEKIETAYFQIPAAVTETRMDMWDIPAELMDSAIACAEAGAERLRDGVFWPPNTNVRFDDYAELLLDDPLSSLASPSQWREVKDV